MKLETLRLAGMTVTYRSGDTWHDRALEITDDSGGCGQDVRICGADTLMAMRDFLNALDFSGRRLTLVK